MNILLTGASGLLGSAFVTAAKRRNHTVIGTVGSFTAHLSQLTESHSLDLNNSSDIERLVLEKFPDAIVNCAAISSPATVDQHPQESQHINIELPEQLARLAHHLSATFIHISSEQVFDGTADIYNIDSPTNPPNTYAIQKAESEKRVHNAAPDFASTLRVPLLNGNSPRGTRSIHEQLLSNWSQKQPTPLFADEFRQPCLVDNLANVMVELCERNDLKGIYHWAGSQVLSRHAMGVAIAKHFGLPEEWAIASTRGHDPKFGSRQARLALDLQPLSGKLKTTPQTFEEQLDSLIVPHQLRSWYNAI